MVAMSTSKMLEGYCGDIEHLLREGSLRRAVRFAIALPDICSTLESPRLKSSHEDYARWCESWLVWTAGSSKPVTGDRVYKLYTRRALDSGAPGAPVTPAHALVRLRMRRYARTHREHGRSRVAQPNGRLEAFQVALCEALLEATRKWYREHGRNDAIVQANIGRLVVSR
jgi:hypothetical protein